MKKRYLDIHDYRAGHYFRQLGTFLGSNEIDDRLRRINLELQSTSGAYKNHRVIPKVSWWIGFREARAIIQRHGSFRSAITPRMLYPLQTATKLSMLYSRMPDFKREEYRSRILSDDILEPTLFEIDCAAHFQQLGHEIEWLKSKSDIGEQTPEFIAKRNNIEIEVECKTKKADAGRRIDRDTFCRIVDNLLPLIQEKGLVGFISLTVRSRIRKDSSWQKEVKEILSKYFSEGSDSICLPDKAVLYYDLKLAEGSRININALKTLYQFESHPFAHHLIMGSKNGEFISDAIVFRLESKKPDAFLDNVLESIRAAKRQFTGTRAALIFCMLPEIDSFNGRQYNSDIKKKTVDFFKKNDDDFINAVTYVSDPKREVDGWVISYNRLSLSFRNHRYNEKYGLNIPIYQ